MRVAPGGGVRAVGRLVLVDPKLFDASGKGLTLEVFDSGDQPFRKPAGNVVF
jgi:hypothetical protein